MRKAISSLAGLRKKVSSLRGDQLEMFRLEKRHNLAYLVTVFVFLLAIILAGCAAMLGEHPDGRVGGSVVFGSSDTSTVTRNPPAIKVEDEKSDSAPKESSD